MAYKLGSLFDGSGGFPLAGSLCGIETVWASEVEPYPIAVTKSRFPNMKHLGSVTDINGGDIEPVDIITFGSPCQDLSVAGKRAGLKHEANGDEETTRSGLFMEAVRIIKEMRAATNGEYPRFALWENVLGAFSSNKGEDFRTVLEELIRIVEPDAVMPPVPSGGWAYADSYSGDGWSLAYRVFDAQYWGVPQRRRRIHLVLDLRGERAREVLFEREGVRWYFETSRTPWQTAPGYVEESPGAGDRAGEGFDGYNGDLLPDDQCGQQINVRTDGAGNGLGVGKAGDPSHTLSTDSLNILVEPVYCLQGNCIDRSDTARCKSRGWREDTSYTLTTIDRPAVAYCTDVGFFNTHGDVSPTLLTRQYKDPHLVSYKETEIQYIVRRLTPTECARLQGFPDAWGHIPERDSLTDEECTFWQDVRDTYAIINGKPQKDYTATQLLTWYNKLHTDSDEYKMWGNGIALPPALYCMQGIVDAMNREDDDTWMQ